MKGYRDVAMNLEGYNNETDKDITMNIQGYKI